MLKAVLIHLLGFLLDERPRWPLWLPVLFGLGISLYFALPVEPPHWTGWGLALAILAVVVAARRHPAALLAALAATALAAGFSAAIWRAEMVAAPVLERPSGKIFVTGTAQDVEPLAGGGQRVTLVAVALDIDGPRPTKVRLRFKSSEPVSVGARLRVAAILMPPQQPAMPGAFDFARFAWFQGLGAVGTALSDPEILAGGGDGNRLNDLRHRMTLRILAALPGSAGWVAAALITGEQTGIPRDVMDAYRDSGLAHLLSISGLHMSLLAGLVFFVVRGGLALVPAVALRYPIKKWAAAVALLATLFYMLLAGAPVPAQRSFLMTGIVLVAVMLDRVAISMRLIAWAALAIMAVAPESLIGPSFQMSFAAVAALIAVYEVATPKLAAWGVEHRGPHHKVMLYLSGVMLSTLVAGSATAIYGAYHFNRFAVWSLVANVIAVPLTGFLVMPFALGAVMLMPFGWEAVALVPMGWGVDAVNRVAAWVASWPAAAITLPVLPAWGLAVFTLGGLWLLLWRGCWRHWGWLAMVIGLASLALHRPPDLLVDSRGYSFAVRGVDGTLMVNRGGRIVKETWTRRAGPLSAERWPKHGRSADGRLSCDELGCLYRVDEGRGGPAALVLDDDGIVAACASAKVVLSAVPIRRGCRGPALIIDRFDLWRRGGHAIWLDGRRVETVAAWQGDRPWAHRPHRRKTKPDADELKAPVATEDD